MATDLTNAVWNKTNVTVDAAGVITENGVAGVHSVYQDLQPYVALGLGNSAVYKARVTPIGRTRCWLGCRQNNGFYMASFDLTGSGSVTSTGSNVTSASIVDEGDGSYTIKVTYNGTLPASNLVFALGAMIADATQSYTGTSIDAIQVTETQVTKGLVEEPYESTTDRQNYLDLATGDGSQDATLPGSLPPVQIDPSYIEFSGGNPLTVSDYAIDLDGLTVYATVSWDGTTGAEKGLLQQWGASQQSWKMAITTDGKLQASLSSNGTSAAKVYTAVTPLDANVRTMVAFTWDGTDLRLYYNDVELTVAGGELVKTTDNALSGNLHDSTSDIEIGDAHYGRIYGDCLYTGDVLDDAAIASVAAGLGLSGLPSGGGGGGGDAGFPQTLAEMETWLINKGVAANDIRYVDNLTGSDSNNGQSTSTPWLTIQKASDELSPGQAVIIRGRGGRFFEQCWLSSSGASGALIWYAGDPENPPIMDASEAFSETWTSQGSNRWRAPYSRSRNYSKSASYTGNLDDTTWMSHQLIHNDVSLLRRNQATVPATLNVGECYFEVGTGSYDSPQYVWCRLPADANPNGESMRIGSDKKYLMDYSPHTWSPDGEAWPGGTNGQEVNGRSYIGLVNMHFRFGCNIRKIGMVAVRGSGWHVEHCSFEHTATIGMTLYGDGHYIYNNHFHANGQMGVHMVYLEDSEIRRCQFTLNNFQYFPPSWEAGGTKVSYCGQSTLIEIHECMFRDNKGVGIWWDIDNGKGNPVGEAFHVHHCYFAENRKGQIFFERVSRYCEVSDTVVWNGKADDEGASGNNIGPGLRSQAANLNTVRRVVVVYNEGKGWLYKPDDSRGPANDDVIDQCAFIQNCRLGAAIDQDQNEIQGGDDIAKSVPWDTSVWTNLLVSNNLGAPMTLFKDREAGVETNSAATFETWTTASGTTVVADPLDVVVDPVDERNCYSFLPAYAAWAPQNFTHPDDYDTNWTTPS